MVFWKSFASFNYFGVQKCINQLFEENKRFECSFYRIQVQVIANLPSRLKKNTKHLTFCLGQIFYEFLKIDNFPNFPKFSENHQLNILKSLYVFYFMLICLQNIMQLDEPIF